MGVKVAATCLQWSQPTTQTLASAISSPASKRRSFSTGAGGGNDGVLVCQYVRRMVFFGTQRCIFKLYRSRSCELPIPKSRAPTIRRAISAGLDSFSDEEFSEKIQDLATKFQLTDDNEGENSSLVEAEQEMFVDSLELSRENQKLFIPVELPEWPEREDEIIPASIERKANSVDLPLSLRIIKRKKQWQKGIKEAGESAYCSVKKAFSSMVFIIRELHSYSLQMREILFYEDLQGILARVEKEMHASFVWLFQQVFSHTPTLMVYVMILLANYSVHSMANTAAIAAMPPPQLYAATAESISTVEDQSQGKQKFDSSVMKSYSVSSCSGKSTSVGGGHGGGGKFRPVASGTDGDGRFDGSVSFDDHRSIVPDGFSVGNATRTSEEQSVSGQVSREEEMSLWNSIVDEASKMQASSRDEALDHETMQKFVSPVNAMIEADDYEDYFRTELLYQAGLSQDPTNSLLLANYAQFLCLVAQDYDRAEDYFKKAVAVEPKDAEALSKYASFLWKVRNDLWAAEETYQEAIAAEPSNSFYAANYAHFLWNTGGEDTCYPLTSPEANADT